MLKWQTEETKRPFKVWAMDVSKQIVCVIVSVYTLVGSWNMKDYCTLYFIVIVTDGVFVNFFSLTLQAIVQNLFHNWQSLKYISGNYASGRIFKSWLYQMCIWTVVCIISKLVVSKLVIWGEIPLYFAASMLLLPFRWNHTLETIIILFVIPCIANVIVM